MKKLMVVPVLLCLFWIGCKPAHPSRVAMDPAFQPNTVNAVLVAPVISAIGTGQDPKRESEYVTNSILMDYLSERTDYRFVSPEQFKMAVAKGKLEPQWTAFQDDWASKHQLDKEFIEKLHLEMTADAVLIPLVYLWNKDEADYREASANSATQVGMTLTLVDMSTGTILWEASDENYKESVRSEGRMTISSAGIDRRVEGVSGVGRDIYAAPPYEDVVNLVLKSIVDALPKRGSAK
jgi:hypothetical protein